MFRFGFLTFSFGFHSGHEGSIETRLEEHGRPRGPHEPQITGSNPVPRINSTNARSVQIDCNSNEASATLAVEIESVV